MVDIRPVAEEVDARIAVPQALERGALRSVAENDERRLGRRAGAESGDEHVHALAWVQPADRADQKHVRIQSELLADARRGPIPRGGGNPVRDDAGQAGVAGESDALRPVDANEPAEAAVLVRLEADMERGHRLVSVRDAAERLAGRAQMPVTYVGGETVNQPAQKEAAGKPVETVKPDLGAEFATQGGRTHAGHMHVVPGGGLTVGEVDAIALGTGET